MNCRCLLLFLSLFALVIFFPLVSSQNSSKELACPSDPLKWCDFYFLSYRTQVPTFDLDKSVGDQVLSSEIWDSQTNAPVSVASVGETVFICSRDEWFRFVPGNQFYSTYSPSALMARTFNAPWDKSFFQNRCILLFLTGIQILGKQPVWNLNPEDNYTVDYPKPRRCVIFKAGPSPPPSNVCNL